MGQKGDLTLSLPDPSLRLNLHWVHCGIIPHASCFDPQIPILCCVKQIFIFVPFGFLGLNSSLKMYAFISVIWVNHHDTLIV